MASLGWSLGASLLPFRLEIEDLRTTLRSRRRGLARLLKIRIVEVGVVGLFFLSFAIPRCNMLH